MLGVVEDEMSILLLEDGINPSSTKQDVDAYVTTIYGSAFVPILESIYHTSDFSSPVKLFFLIFFCFS